MHLVEKIQTKTCPFKKEVEGERVGLNIGNEKEFMSVSIKVDVAVFAQTDSRGRRAEQSIMELVHGQDPHICTPVFQTHRVHWYLLLIQKNESPRFHLRFNFSSIFRFIKIF